MAEAIVNLVPSDISRPFSSVKGTLNWPVSGKVLQNYGGQIGRGPMKSQGLVIDVPADTVVKSVYHGRVVFADWLNGYGLMVIVDHGEGYMSLYARNEVLMRSVGEWVNRGDTIARSGDTGLRETGLYFEIRRQGQPQNPRLWLARK